MSDATDIQYAIKHSNLIEGIDDREQDVQSLIAWEWLVTQDVLSHHTVCKLQKLITLKQSNLVGAQRGYYRDMTATNVQVGGYVAPKYQEVEGLMAKWLEDEPLGDPKLSHIAFETIHPFVDGNGRTGRMLYYWRLMRRNEYGMLPPAKIIKLEDRQAYYDWFRR